MHIENKKLKLGTRRSLLALAQSKLVAIAVERANPGIEVELVGIETRGDQVQNIPLSKIEGKEFFVAEIDHALKSGEVDFTVHSLKDLSLDRPDNFVCAAIPVRENPRDAVLFSLPALEKLKNGSGIRIGTSSPRRLENIPEFLHKALPLGSHSTKLEFVEIRGNVNTRLSRLHLPKEDDKALDAVVLAFAGLIRLWKDAEGKRELQKLLKDVKWMILPLVTCPAAPGQGALAIECRKDDLQTRRLIFPLHNEDTAGQVARERELLKQWGGGCHQKFGATCIQVPELGEILYIRGRKTNGEFVSDLQWRAPKGMEHRNSWDGSKHASVAQFIPRTPNSKAPGSLAQVFVANAKAATAEYQADLLNSRVWVSGISSWFKLAKQGIFVEGCAEGFGYEFITQTTKEDVLGLSNKWTILTHDKALDSWPSDYTVLSTYRSHRAALSTVELDQLLKAKTIFWASGSQFETLKDCVRPDVIHCCGTGKTAGILRKHGIKPLIFPCIEEWRKWIRITT